MTVNNDEEWFWNPLREPRMREIHQRCGNAPPKSNIDPIDEGPDDAMEKSSACKGIKTQDS